MAPPRAAARALRVASRGESAMTPAMTFTLPAACSTTVRLRSSISSSPIPWPSPVLPARTMELTPVETRYSVSCRISSRASSSVSGSNAVTIGGMIPSRSSWTPWVNLLKCAIDDLRCLVICCPTTSSYMQGIVAVNPSCRITYNLQSGHRRGGHVPELFLLDPGQGPVTSLAGFVRQHPWIHLSPDPLYVHHTRARATRRVAVVSGGGTGHEPMHSGFVGPGMLDAAVPGKVFASPHNRQVYEASKAVAREGGVLHVVKNYTGDKINFGIAAERLAADGIEVARVLVDDDVATESDQTATGRRGTGATVIVEKIVGAAADRGDGLKELADLGQSVVAHSRSIAVASSALTSPHTGQRMFELAEGEL